jgi:hypothetical protein
MLYSAKSDGFNTILLDAFFSMINGCLYFEPDTAAYKLKFDKELETTGIRQVGTGESKYLPFSGLSDRFRLVITFKNYILCG